jgi:hypothetical protein
MGERLPLLLTQAEALMDAVQRAPGSEPSLAVLGEVDALLEAARTADATRLIRFFHGLHSFITLLSAGLIAIPPPRVAAVIGKVRELPSVAEEWVQIGRTQRAALLDVLPR